MKGILCHALNTCEPGKTAGCLEMLMGHGCKFFQDLFFKGADVSGELTLNEDLTWIKVMRDSKIDRSFGVCFNDGHVTGGGEGGGG